MNAPPPALVARIADVAARLLSSGSAARAERSPERELARIVRETSELYTRQRESIGEATASREALAARVAFYLPRDLPKIASPVEELAALGLVPDRPLRILDVGAGVGATSLGLVLALRRLGFARPIAIDAIDRDERPLALMREIAAGPREIGLGDLVVDTEQADLFHARVRGTYDLVLLGLVLNELGVGASDEHAVERSERVLRHGGTLLGGDGSMIAIEPALREATRRLHRVRDRIVGDPQGLFVFAPCLGAPSCPMLAGDRDWCHEDRPYALEGEAARTARGAGLRYERLTYAYLTLRHDRRSLRELHSSAFRVVSQQLVSKGKRELFVCGSEGKTRLTRLDRDENANNAAFEAAQRGDVLVIEPTPSGDKARVSRDATVKRLSRRPRTESTE